MVRRRGYRGRGDTALYPRTMDLRQAHRGNLLKTYKGLEHCSRLIQELIRLIYFQARVYEVIIIMFIIELHELLNSLNIGPCSFKDLSMDTFKSRVRCFIHYIHINIPQDAFNLSKLIPDFLRIRTSPYKKKVPPESVYSVTYPLDIPLHPLRIQVKAPLIIIFPL